MSLYNLVIFLVTIANLVFAVALIGHLVFVCMTINDNSKPRNTDEIFNVIMLATFSFINFCALCCILPAKGMNSEISIV